LEGNRAARPPEAETFLWAASLDQQTAEHTVRQTIPITTAMLYQYRFSEPMHQMFPARFSCASGMNPSRTEAVPAV
jgi:hypothetical protein